MDLRDHPLMTHMGTRSWPPVWTRSGSLKNPVTLPRAEVGILKHVVRHDDQPDRCFLLMAHEPDYYIGCLMFDDHAFCKLIHELLQFCIGRSIQEIGSIDLSHTL